MHSKTNRIMYKPLLIKWAYHQECNQKLETRASEHGVLKFGLALEPGRKTLLLNWSLERVLLAVSGSTGRWRNPVFGPRDFKSAFGWILATCLRRRYLRCFRHIEVHLRVTVRATKTFPNLVGGHSSPEMFPKVAQSRSKDAKIVPQVVPRVSKWWPKVQK